MRGYSKAIYIDAEDIMQFNGNEIWELYSILTTVQNNHNSKTDVSHAGTEVLLNNNSIQGHSRSFKDKGHQQLLSHYV